MSVDYTIIIPAYNEEKYLPATLTALQDAMTGTRLNGQIIVVNNNSTDKTADIAVGHGAQVEFEGFNQISRARNTGARRATGRYLVFVDADTLVPHELLKQALDNLESGVVIGGGARMKGDKPLRLSMKLLFSFWDFISVHTRTAAGSFIYCRRDAFETVNGFNEKVYASEEIWLSRKLKKLGKKRGQAFCIIREPPVITSMRKLDWYSPLYIYSYAFMVAVFPFVVRIRSLCKPWYDRSA